MKKIFILLCFVINMSLSVAQTVLTIEGTVVNNTDTAIWEGVSIPRSVPTSFTYRNNAITAANTTGYLLQAGDEGPGNFNNHLDGETITGNQFAWNGTDMTCATHGIFTGYELNAIIKYNYLNAVPMGIIRKSNGMTDTSGVVGYNIIKNPQVGIVVKGMNGVKIYNNTFYQERTTSETIRGLIDIYVNADISPKGAATGTKIFNNIFYTKHQTRNIIIYQSECLAGFESDYNLFWCEDGTPMFNIGGEDKTFAQWQAMGYDTHSVVVNPDFEDEINFVPGARLDYGTNLGAIWQSGISTNASWSTTDPDTTNQNGTWQVGACLYAVSNNNQLPSIQNQDFKINENSPEGTAVGTVVAADPDAGQNLTYTIRSGNTNGTFAINDSTGALTVADPSALNYEVVDSFALIIKVKDNGAGHLSNQAVVTITLLDINEPPIISDQAFSIIENSANETFVGTVLAVDPDAGQTITFSILSGNTNNAFEINSSTGTIAVANAAALNYEADTSFALTVLVQDNGTEALSGTAIVVITLINIHEHTVIDNQYFVVNELAPKRTVVGTVAATDPDTCQLLTFVITAGNSDRAFSINPLNGIIMVNNNLALNRNTNPLFQLTVAVHCDDSEQFVSHATINIYILNSRLINIPSIKTIGPDTIPAGLSYPLKVFDFSKKRTDMSFSADAPLNSFSPADNSDGTDMPEGFPIIEAGDFNPMILQKENNCTPEVPPAFSFQGTTTTGDYISDQTADGIQICPNPVTHGILQVELDNGIHQPFDLSIMELSGKVLLQKHYEPINSLFIDLSAYPPALYIIQIRFRKFLLSDKFIIR